MYADGIQSFPVSDGTIDRMMVVYTDANLVWITVATLSVSGRVECHVNPVESLRTSDPHCCSRRRGNREWKMEEPPLELIEVCGSCAGRKVQSSIQKSRALCSESTNRQRNDRPRPSPIWTSLAPDSGQRVAVTNPPSDALRPAHTGSGAI